MKILFSGFEAFGDRDINPTSFLMNALEAKEIFIPQELVVDQITLPVTFRDSYQLLQKRIHEFNPDIVMCFGLAEKRECIEFEEIALNLINARIPDNNGDQPGNRRINPIGADSYLSTLPISGLSGALSAADIKVQTSQNAGEYVCNYLFYRLMEDNQETGRLCGFIHIPLLSEHAKKEEASLSWDELKKAVEVMLDYLKYD